MSIREGYRIRLGSFKKQQQSPEKLRSSSPRVLDPFAASHPMASRSGYPKKRNETLRFIVITFCGVALGFFIGIFFTGVGLTYTIGSNFLRAQDIQSYDPLASAPIRQPRGTGGLPLGIIVPETDLYQRRLWGKPSEDLPDSPSKYLVTFTVGIKQKEMVDKAVSKFPKEWTILLFHYDGVTDEWDDLEWSKTAIHISAKKQTKWWYAKRFLHPDVVAPYDYIFIWDEDLDVENFDAQKYIQLVIKYGLEISQPGLANPPDKRVTWQMTKRREDVEVHKTTEEREGWCSNPNLPPCAAFVEIMAPVFSRKAWRCVWHMIQNDLVHGWGLDFSMRKCVHPAHEKIGVVDAQWIKHQVVPSLGEQGQATDGKQPWEGVRERCNFEWKVFSDRIDAAEKRGPSSSLPTEP